MDFSIGCGITDIINKQKDTGEFSPSDIADLEIWLDASDASSVVLNGSDVSQWSDKSGNNRHFPQGTASKQPAYVDQLNGENVITFDGVDDYLRNATTSLSQPSTIFFALKQDSDPGDFVAFLEATEPVRWTFAYDGRPGWDRVTLSVNSTIVYNEDPANLNFNLYTVVVNGASSSITRGDSLLVSGNVGTEGSSAAITLGATSETPFQFFPGKMAEFILYGKTLTSSENTKVRNYFADKWGI